MGTLCYNNHIPCPKQDKWARNECGAVPDHQWHLVRRSAALLETFHKTGTTNLLTLPKWGQREPAEAYGQMLEAYCANASREGRKCDSTIKATKSVIRRFLFALEDKTYCVEVELSQKAKDRLIKNLKDNFMAYDHQRWIVPQTQMKIRKIIGEQSGAYPNIEVLTLEEVTEYVKQNQVGAG